MVLELNFDMSDNELPALWSFYESVFGQREGLISKIMVRELMHSIIRFCMYVRGMPVWTDVPTSRA